MRKYKLFVFLFFLILFSILCYIYTPELKTDSFCHFLNSVRIITSLDFKSLATNIWDKPIPIIIYGIPGVLGLFFSRLAGAILVLFTAYFTCKLAHFYIKNIPEDSILTIVFFLLMIPVFGQAFVTMTELPAAFILVLGLYLFYGEKKYFAAFFTIGLLPLARVESSLIMAFIFLSFARDIFRVQHLVSGTKGLIDSLRSVTLYFIIGSLPFILWVVMGAYFTYDLFWIMRSSYAHLRPFDLFYIIKHNAITALPMIFTAPALFLFLVGVFSPKNAQKDNKYLSFLITIYGVMIIHLVFLSAIIPFPKGEVEWKKLISAWNDRNFNVIAPVMALFIYMGASYVYDIFHNNTHRAILTTGIIKTILLFFLSIALIITCSKEFPFASTPRLYIITLCFFLTGTFLVILKEKKTLSASLFLNALSILIILSYLIINPLFWNPTKYNDPDIIIQGELWGWVKSNYEKKNITIIQDLSGSMEYYIGKKNVHAPWVWASSFISKIKASPPRTLIILETIGIFYDPHPRYPFPLVECIKKYKVLKKSSSKWPYGWIIYEKE